MIQHEVDLPVRPTSSYISNFMHFHIHPRGNQQLARLSGSCMHTQGTRSVRFSSSTDGTPPCLLACTLGGSVPLVAYVPPTCAPATTHQGPSRRSKRKRIRAVLYGVSAAYRGPTRASHTRASLRARLCVCMPRLCAFRYTSIAPTTYSDLRCRVLARARSWDRSPGFHHEKSPLQTLEKTPASNEIYVVFVG
jgi:hypothetical protein